MILATYNVNSIRARLERLLEWLDQTQPDIVCLQETKVIDEDFPYEPLEELEYEAAVAGEKSYNGVAILSRLGIEEFQVGLGEDVDDKQSRFISARIEGVRIANLYVPNGSQVYSDKYQYKLTWLNRIAQWLNDNADRDEPLIVCGDLNVAPEDRDARNPEKWRDSVLCHQDTRDRFQALMDWGLTDLFRRLNPDADAWSFWDYQQLAFVKDDGLRIDHILATDPMVERAVECRIDREARKGSKPSDHAPVIAEFRD